MCSDKPKCVFGEVLVSDKACGAMSSEEDMVIEAIRNKAQSEGLRLRPYKAARDDAHTAYISEYTQGFVSGETPATPPATPESQR